MTHCCDTTSQPINIVCEKEHAFLPKDKKTHNIN